MIQALLMSINFEKQNGMWERGKPRAHSEKRGCWLWGRSWQGKWETWRHLRPAQPGGHTLSSFVWGGVEESPPLHGLPAALSNLLWFLQGHRGKGPCECVVCHPWGQALVSKGSVSLCLLCKGVTGPFPPSIIPPGLCMLSLHTMLKSTDDSSEQLALPPFRQSPGTSTSLDWLQGIGMCLLDLKASYKLFSVVSLESPCTGGRGRSQLATWPFTQQVRKSQQKGHLSLLLGNKSTFVLLAQLKECHYYQINCVVTNQSSQLSFKCELWWLSGLHTCFHSQDTTEFKLHI